MFQLSRYLSQGTPANITAASAYHLEGLLNERLGHYSTASGSFAKAAQLLEAEYEENESPEVEHDFVLANLSLARAKLANENYSSALQALESALGLLDSPAAGVNADTPILRVQALLLKALAYYWSDAIQDCLEAFEEAKNALQDVSADEESQYIKNRLSNQTTILLARVLYCLGGEEQVAEAESQLLEK